MSAADDIHKIEPSNTLATQRNIATDQATVGALKRGARGAYYIGTIQRLCETLGVAPEDLLSGSGQNEAKRSIDTNGR